jgi:hypothetical protein
MRACLQNTGFNGGYVAVTGTPETDFIIFADFPAALGGVWFNHLSILSIVRRL